MTQSPALSPALAREVVVEACRLGDATLDSYIDDLWAAKSDPDLMRRLLGRLRREVEEARALLAAAAEPEWWSDASPERLAAACTAARIWPEGDPECAELERRFASHLRGVLGVDIAAIPRRSRTP
ncbi:MULTISPECIES: hypothetical protein [unclassified Rathayibacter]|uniref:hypothetical protein n=1 Tax=unclassified Rathayibacter TaxID=2609250 RepID=UPI0007019147|nr:MULTISPECIES: hypothetical protein [unclassified Rathayibacter]KQQ03444.1 hypothetical protein ASF42_07945 [Rathayibacter sp. Leaf294]KQS11900.1 hypothetical protein ASG06_07945 [Rathayibacter sp. Leaf185]